jgi:hypothetical protein
MTPTETPTPAPTQLFPEPQVLRLCSANVCGNGHEWIPKVTLAKCGYGTPQGWNGCGAPVLAVKVESCPICNEPVRSMRFRTDHTPPTQFIIPVCIPGSVTPADIAEVVLQRNSTKVEQEYEKRFPALPTPEAPVEPQQEKQ